VNVSGQSNAVANQVRCAMGAASSSLVRALRTNLTRSPQNGLAPSAFDPLTGLGQLGTSESLNSLAQRFSGSQKLCSIDALRTIGVPDELLSLACAEVDPIGAGSSSCSCGGLCDVDAVLMEDPDNRPYVWDQEEECH